MSPIYLSVPSEHFIEVQEEIAGAIWNWWVQLKKWLLGLIAWSHSDKQENLTQNSLDMKGAVMSFCYSFKVLDEANYAKETAITCFFWITHTQSPSIFSWVFECWIAWQALSDFSFAAK